MKKCLKILFLLCFVFRMENNVFSYALEEETGYAKALENCVLYKSKEMNNTVDDILFIVPETYFVNILEIVDKDFCYMVQYEKYIGYVNPATIIKSTFTPIVKSLNNITFDIKQSSGTQIWSAPSTKANIYTTLSAGVKNIRYIAFAKGDIPDGGESDIWYYVSYTPSENSTNVYEGYIYSENTTNLSEIIANLEVNPEINFDIKSDENLLYISSTIKTIVVAVIVIPFILFFVIILYKLIKKLNKNTKYNNNLKNLNNGNVDSNKEQTTGFVKKFKEMFRVKNNSPTHEFIEMNDDELL